MKKSTFKFILTKILELILTLFIVTIISFLLMKLSPIDAAEAYAKRNFAQAGFSQAQLDALRVKMGLNKSLIAQYSNWINNALHLQFGNSLVSGRSVFIEVSTSIKITMATVLLSGVIQIIFIIIIGSLCYLTSKNIIGALLNFLCIAGLSFPPFFIASLFIDTFAVKYGMMSVAGNTGFTRYLPVAVCLAIGCIAFFSQLLSQQIGREMNGDSAFYLQCCGLSDKHIIFSYAMPRALVSILPNFFQMLGLCMAGAIIVERVFSLPGLGNVIIDSILHRDSPMIHATILFLAFSLAIFNIIADIIRRFLMNDSLGKTGV